MNCNTLLFLTEREQQAVSAYVEALRSRYNRQVLTIALFGSKSRGDAGPDSDVDILIVTGRDNWRLWWDLTTIAAEISLQYNVLLDPRIIGQERWIRMEQEHDPLWQNIHYEGIILVPDLSPSPA